MALSFLSLAFLLAARSSLASNFRSMFALSLVACDSSLFVFLDYTPFLALIDRVIGIGSSCKRWYTGESSFLSTSPPKATPHDEKEKKSPQAQLPCYISAIFAFAFARVLCIGSVYGSESHRDGKTGDEMIDTHCGACRSSHPSSHEAPSVYLYAQPNV